MPALRAALSSPLLVIGLALTSSGFAQQVVPDADAALRQQLELERQRKLPQPTPPAPAASGPARTAPAGPTLLVKRFIFEGNERYTDAQLAPIVAGYLQRRVSLEDLEVAAADIARYYRAAGWVARVVVPPQQVDQGEIRLKIIEGVLGQTRFPDGSNPETLPVKPTVIVGNVQARQAPGDKLNIPAVERGLLLADDLPGIGVAGSQVAGRNEGETDTDGASGALVASKLLLLGGNVTLDSTLNNVGTLAASGVGSLSYVDADALTIGTVGSTNGISATGAVSVATTTGDMTLSQGVATTNTGTSAIILNAGASAAAGTAIARDKNGREARSKLTIQVKK